MNFFIKWVLIIGAVIVGYLLFVNYVYPMLCSYYAECVEGSEEDCDSAYNCSNDCTAYPPGHPKYKATNYKDIAVGKKSWTKTVKTSLGITDQAFDDAAEYVADSTPGYYGWLAKIGLILKNGGATARKNRGNKDGGGAAMSTHRFSQSIESECANDDDSCGAAGAGVFDYKSRANQTMKKKVERYKRESMQEAESMFVRKAGLAAIRELVIKYGGNVNKNYKEDVLLDISKSHNDSQYVFVDSVVVGSGNSFGLKFRNYYSSEFPNSRHKSREEFDYYRRVELAEIEDAISSGLFLIEVPWNVYMYELKDEDAETGDVAWNVDVDSEFNRTVKSDPERHNELITERFLQYIQYHLSSGYQEFLLDNYRNPYPKFYY